MSIISCVGTFFKESAGKSRAEIMRGENDVYSIHYYDLSGQMFSTETFEGKSLFYVENVANKWADGINVLNG